MREFLGLVLSIGLPWLAGTLGVVLARQRNDRFSWMLAVGYGYPLGAFAATLIMRSLDAASIRWTLPIVALPMLVLTAALLGLAAKKYRGSQTSFGAPQSEAIAGSLEPQPIPGSLRILFWLCFALITIRVAGLAAEIVLRPLQPWDAWAHWATKSKVWFYFGQMAPFVTQEQWLAPGDAMRFVDMNSSDPGTLPLLQVWTNVWLGQWNESLMNAPWCAVAVALGVAFYAQLRRFGASAPKAMLFTYLALSLPFLDVHVALAGVADLFVAVMYGMAAMSLWQWTRTRQGFDLALAAATILVLVSVKAEGALWALTLVPPVVVSFRRRLGLGMAFLVAVAAIVYLAVGPDEIIVSGYAFRPRFQNVSLPLMQQLFVMDNWHLLWFGAIAVVVLRRRRLLAPDMIAATITMWGALGLVFVVYFFSSSSGGAEDETLVNPMLLHVAPALAFYLALLLHEAPGAIKPDKRTALPS